MATPKKPRTVDVSTTKSTERVRYEDGSTRIIDKAKGGRAQPATHGVGGGVVSKKPKPMPMHGAMGKKPDMAVAMKRMLRRK